jgi:hypothetical protein
MTAAEPSNIVHLPESSWNRSRRANCSPRERRTRITAKLGIMVHLAADVDYRDGEG